MKVSQTVELPDGTVTFSGELAKEELALVVEVGLNYLLQKGALPLKVVTDESLASVDQFSDNNSTH